MVNYIILTILVIGSAMIIGSMLMDKKSSFEDGSFLIQSLLIIVGIACVAGALLWKLIYSLVA